MDPSAAPAAIPTKNQIPEHLFSPNQSLETIAEATKLVTCQTRPWKLVASPPALQRKIKFKSFATAMKFWNAVVGECKVHKHHPEWGNVYNEVVVRWTTHRPRGISSKDVRMARFCDTTADTLGEVVDAAQPGPNHQDGQVKKENNQGVKGDTLSRDPSTNIPYKSELSYPGVPPTEHKTEESDLLASLFGSEEQTCTPCHTGKKISKASSTKSGAGNPNVKPKDTSPHLESTEGQSMLEEMKKKRDKINLAEPGLGGLTENMETAVEKEKKGMEWVMYVLAVVI